MSWGKVSSACRGQAEVHRTESQEAVEQWDYSLCPDKVAVYFILAHAQVVGSSDLDLQKASLRVLRVELPFSAGLLVRVALDCFHYCHINSSHVDVADDRRCRRWKSWTAASHCQGLSGRPVWPQRALVKLHLLNTWVVLTSWVGCLTAPTFQMEY